ncbi:MAG: J domain-containing protein [Flavobacteriales bacterium]
MSKLEDQYRTLGLQLGATEEEVRQAYRAIAKQYHPDVNKTPGAEQRFITAHMAYEAVIQSIRNPQAFYKKVVNPFQGADQAQAAKRRAYEFAKKRYDDYLASDEFQEDENYESVARLVGFVIVVLCTVLVPMASFRILGDWSFMPVFVVLYLCFSPVVFPAWRGIMLVEWPRVKHGWRDFVKQSVMLHFFILLLNIWWFFHMALFAFVPTWPVVAVFLIASLILRYVVLPRFHFLYIKAFVAAAVTLMGINIFLFINQVHTSQPVTESYFFSPYEFHYTSRSKYSDKRYPKTEVEPYLLLENDAYDDYPLIRLFCNYQAVEGNVVTFRIEKGWLGVRVLKSYEFANVGTD